MKTATLPRSLFAACLLLSAAAGLAAAPPPPAVTATFVDGAASLQPKGKPARDLAIGDRLATGDSVRTGADGLAELDRGGVVLKINPKTVFTLSERSVQGQNRDVVNVVVGSVKMKYDKLSGNEPLIKTATCAAAVRGTEITVCSGEDGAALIAVDSGLLEVSAAGQTVSLAAGEGIEVPTGKAPGPKFAVQSRQVDYRTWNDARVQAMLADPLAALADLQRLLGEYADAAAGFDSQYRELAARLADERAKLLGIRDQQGEEAFNSYRDSTVTPLSFEAAAAVLNKRFQALAAFSMRRYVAGRLYLQLKPQSADPARAADWAAFERAYQTFLADYEAGIVPHLVEADY
jgi:hypothetical protein